MAWSILLSVSHVFVIPEQVQYVDVILCNRYYAWYQDSGQTQLISLQLEGDLRAWFDTFHKPVVQSEYGADTIAGLHTVSYQLNKTFLSKMVNKLCHANSACSATLRSFSLPDTVGRSVSQSVGHSVNQTVS